VFLFVWRRSGSASGCTLRDRSDRCRSAALLTSGEQNSPHTLFGLANHGYLCTFQYLTTSHNLLSSQLGRAFPRAAARCPPLHRRPLCAAATARMEAGFAPEAARAVPRAVEAPGGSTGLDANAAAPAALPPPNAAALTAAAPPSALPAPHPPTKTPAGPAAALPCASPASQAPAGPALHRQVGSNHSHGASPPPSTEPEASAEAPEEAAPPAEAAAPAAEAAAEAAPPAEAAAPPAEAAEAEAEAAPPAAPPPPPPPPAAAALLITGPQLEALLASSHLPPRLMVRMTDADATGAANPFFRADVLAIDAATSALRLRFQYRGEPPFWLWLESPRLWRGEYPLVPSTWINLGKVRR